MKTALAPIDGGEVRLRLLAETDLPMTLDWRNREETRRWLKNSQALALDQHRRWFADYQQRDNEFMFVIEEKAGGNAIGQVGIYDIDHAARQAEIGRFIAAPTGAGRGLMKQAMKAMCDWALGPLGLTRLYCDIFADNLPSVRACEWAGFRVTGRKDEFLVLERFAESFSSPGVPAA